MQICIQARINSRAALCPTRLGRGVVKWPYWEVPLNWWNPVMVAFSLLSFSFEQNKEVATISSERMRSRLVNQEGEIVGMFRTWREVSKKGKGFVILLLRSLRPHEIWNNSWTSRKQFQGFFCFCFLILYLFPGEPRVTQGCPRHFYLHRFFNTPGGQKHSKSSVAKET